MKQLKYCLFKANCFLHQVWDCFAQNASYTPSFRVKKSPKPPNCQSSNLNQRPEILILYRIILRLVVTLESSYWISKLVVTFNKTGNTKEDYYTSKPTTRLEVNTWNYFTTAGQRFCTSRFIKIVTLIKKKKSFK